MLSNGGRSVEMSASILSEASGSSAESVSAASSDASERELSSGSIGEKPLFSSISS